MNLSARWLLAACLLAWGVLAHPAAAQTVNTLSTGYTSPQYVAVDSQKTVWVTDSSHPLSALVYVNGAYGTTPTAFGGSTAEFTDPAGLAVDPGGTVHIANNPAAGQVGFWEALPPDYTSINGLACSCSGTPGGAALDSHGNFFVANSSAALLEITAPGYSGLVTLSAGTHPAALAFDSQNNLFIADQLSGSGQILELTASSGYSTSITISAGNFKAPAGVAIDSRGNLYVTDSTNNTLTELAAPDYTVAAVIDSTHFSGPKGVAIDADDNIFIADTGHNAVKEIPAQPAVIGVASAAGPIGGGNSVTVTGAHFAGASAVTFGGAAATAFTIVNDTQIIATVPAGSVGTVDVRVATANGTSIAVPADRYRYTAAPTVSSLSPATGSTVGGNFVTISGGNFAGATAVTFGSSASSSFSVLGNTLISAAVPAGAAGIVDVTVTTAGGTSATGAGDHYTYVAAPAVGSVAPAAGPTGGGTVVTITGARLTGATSVNFGAVPATNFTINSATQITAAAPPGSAGTVDITVATIGGTSATTAADSFTYVAAPVVSGLSLAGGPTTGGTIVTITGSNLGTATAVKFGGTAATSFTVNGATQITAIAPPGSAGAVDVTVTTTGGTSATSAADQYTYLNVPVVSGISPTHGPTNGGTAVIIAGSGFTGATVVNFGGAAAASFTVDSATQITATAPAGSAGAVDVTVTTAAGTSATTAADSFTYVALPVVSGISPANGPVRGGTSVIVTGSNFSGASAVSFGAAAAAGFTVNSPTQITAIAPPGSAGTIDITVTTAGGASAVTAADQYTYIAQPAVSMIGPNQGPIAGGTTVTLTGSAFTGASAVRFGTLPATSFTVASATQITAVAPARAAGAVHVTVTTGGGTSTASVADSFTYVAVPTVSGLSPAAGPTTGGKSVVIAGTNLTAATSVRFGAVPATSFAVNNANRVTAIAPPGSAGMVDVQVTTAGGVSAAGAADRYSYFVPPTVSSVLPNTGAIKGGTAVAITGAGFTGATSVKFGTAAAGAIHIVNDRRVTVTAPAHAAGLVDITVTTPAGASEAVAADGFTYVAPPIAGPASTTVDYDSTANPVTLALTGGRADSVSVASTPKHGTATASGTAIRYTPAAGYVGEDSFTYRATNVAGTSEAAKLTVTVQPPDATVIYRFTGGRDGALPSAPLSLGPGGTLYGTITPIGNVFSLTPPRGGQTDWQFRLLRTFTNPAPPDNRAPMGLFRDSATGVLYGATGDGRCLPSDIARCSRAYSLTPPRIGTGTWPLAALYPFSKAATGASNPISPLVGDGHGALYGMSAPLPGSTTSFGSVYRLSPPVAAGGAWTQTVLYSFKGGVDGAASAQPLLVDAKGNLYGVTSGTQANPGSVFRLSPPAGGKTPWIETVLLRFHGFNGAFPSSPLVADGMGALYGVTEAGGTIGGSNATGTGVVYRLTPPASGSAWTTAVLYRFAGAPDGAVPMGPIALDAAGAIYGATRVGGERGFGSVFRLKPPAGAGTVWTETVLHSFRRDSNGGVPVSGVVLGSDGALYGQARVGGIVTVAAPFGAGTIFRIPLTGP